MPPATFTANGRGEKRNVGGCIRAPVRPIEAAAARWSVESFGRRLPRCYELFQATKEGCDQLEFIFNPYVASASCRNGMESQPVVSFEDLAVFSNNLRMSYRTRIGDEIVIAILFDSRIYRTYHSNRVLPEWLGCVSFCLTNAITTFCVPIPTCQPTSTKVFAIDARRRNSVARPLALPLHID